jgi:hypothetical protein
MLYITWVNDRLGHPHAVWNASTMATGSISNQEIDGLNRKSTSRPLTGRHDSGQVTIAPMPKTRLGHYSNN